MLNSCEQYVEIHKASVHDALADRTSTWELYLCLAGVAVGDLIAMTASLAGLGALEEH
ncbi:MAG: hypothetical protein OET79_11035 [Nitrospirota bacterium]|nr:hypothetical protein [Nitrospirota bacterium]